MACGERVSTKLHGGAAPMTRGEGASNRGRRPIAQGEVASAERMKRVSCAELGVFRASWLPMDAWWYWALVDDARTLSSPPGMLVCWYVGMLRLRELGHVHPPVLPLLDSGVQVESSPWHESSRLESASCH
eukprot:370548-Pyramimonas_sp.AAC.1